MQRTRKNRCLETSLARASLKKYAAMMSEDRDLSEVSCSQSEQGLQGEVLGEAHPEILVNLKRVIE
jgi:hypothetical protein